jgi:cation diffusion facilitator family transporter
LNEKLTPHNEPGPLADNGKKIAAYSTFINIALTVTKAFLALLSGSAAVLSEAVHSLTDVLGNLTVWMGITISRKKSPNFPWGLYKVENIVAVISALLIFLVAYELMKETFITEAKAITNINTSALVLGILIIPVYLFARFEKNEAEKMNSPSLMADAQHWLTDIASLGVVIGGLLASRFFPHADKGASLIVIVVVVHVGYGILKNSIKSLLDASVDADTLRKIGDIIRGFEEVEAIRSLHARNSGSFIFVHIDLRLSVKKLKHAHRVADTVEQRIRREIPFIERVSIHYEPVKKEYRRHSVPLANREGLISEHFGSAPFISIWDTRVSDSEILSQEIIANPFMEMEKGKGIKLAELLIDKKIDILYTKEVFEGKGPQYVLSDAEIEVRKTDLQNLKDLME